MAIVLSDILVAINGAEYSFDKTVEVMNDASPAAVVGYASLEHRSDQLYATLHLEKDETAYLDKYPIISFDTTNKIVLSIILSAAPNEDVRIERIKDQELFQSSSGADHAEME